MKPLNKKDLARLIFINLKTSLVTADIKYEELIQNPALKEQLTIMALNQMITNQTVRDINEKDIDERIRNPQRRYEKEGTTFYVVDGGKK